MKMHPLGLSAPEDPPPLWLGVQANTSEQAQKPSPIPIRQDRGGHLSCTKTIISGHHGERPRNVLIQRPKLVYENYGS
jgi:hypothetical protein